MIRKSFNFFVLLAMFSTNVIKALVMHGIQSPYFQGLICYCVLLGL